VENVTGQSEVEGEVTDGGETEEKVTDRSELEGEVTGGCEAGSYYSSSDLRKRVGRRAEKGWFGHYFLLTLATTAQSRPTLVSTSCGEFACVHTQG
jgi:hypothetical protein